MGEQAPGTCDKRRYDALEQVERARLEFVAAFQRDVLARRPDYAEALASAANALTALGYYADGLAFDRRLAELKPDDALVIYNLSCSLALVGDADDAFAALEKALALGYRDLAHLADDEDWANLRDDPRFLALLNRVCDGDA